MSAGLGQANTVGRLSVPSAWTVAAPEIRPVAFTLPITGAEAVPETAVSGSGNLFADMALAGAAGRAVGGTAALGHSDQRAKMPSRKPAQQPAREPVAEIAAELRDLATRAQSLLAKLADSGLMTAEEVTEQKQRFRW